MIATNSRAAYFAALRPKQWTKNLIVFAAPLFNFSANLTAAFGGLLAFILFCCVSSSFYLINDILDVESDRKHPVKCKRPIAAGLIPIPVAMTMAIGLLGSAITIGSWRSTNLGISIVAYGLLQIAYNLRLKRTVILDICAIAAGFVLRAYGGAAATDVRLSPWFLLCTAMLALFLGVEKRKAELRLAEINGKSTRAVLKRYSMPLLARMESTVTTGAVMSYALWSSGPQVKGATTPYMLLTLPFVVYGIFRYQLLSDPQEIIRKSKSDLERGGQSERPEEVLLTDLPLLFTVIGWIITIFLILFFQNQGLLN